MRLLYSLGVGIQIIGYIVAGTVVLRIMTCMSGFGMQWWEWLTLPVLIFSARHLLREGLALCTMAIKSQKRNI